MDYPVEQFTEQEKARLTRHFTNIDRPVFALVNLPETVKGALFARYSRYGGTLRRLFLDEFADSIEVDSNTWDGDEGKRAADLYERIFLGYGDDSVAQLGGAHIAFEWVSNVMTKILQRPRLAAYLEQSTRYIAYDSPMDARGFRYYRSSELGADYESAMDNLFTVYQQSLPKIQEWLEGEFPANEGEPEAARKRALKAKSLDLLRGLLPASSLSHMGTLATGQTYEQLILHLLANPLPEARFYGNELLETMKAIMPSFVSRVERADRGGEWIGYLRQRQTTAQEWANKLGLNDNAADDDGPSVRLIAVDGDETNALAALLFEATGCSEVTAKETVERLSGEQQLELMSSLVGERNNRRHRPGRGFERLRYRFEIVSDYGAFRDLQRHRLLTVQWQTLSPHHGAEVPEEIKRAGIYDEFQRALDGSANEYFRLKDLGLAELAPYALCLAYRIRYILDLNAREAMHLIELRSGREGHPSYRAVAQAMHDQIAEHHPNVAASMNHVDRFAEPRLERILSEIKQSRRAGAVGRT